jgi:hypothetical protein
MGIRLRALSLLLLGGVLAAGPPYLTDDPEPVPLGHWEVFLFTQGQRLGGVHSGLRPAMEANYGPFQNAQLQVQIPLAYADSDDGIRHRGLGDLQAGFKYRFQEESDGMPQLAVYPQVQAPTGRDADGLGAGHWRVFLPLWLQKSFGPWTTYGGGGWWHNPGLGNRNCAVFGWLIQRELAEGTSLGFEVFRQGSPAMDQPSTTALNLGFELALGHGLQAIASGGKIVQGASGGQFYVGLRGSF